MGLTVAQRRSGEEAARSALDLKNAQSLANAIALSEELTAENALLTQRVSDTAQLNQSVPVFTQRELVTPERVSRTTEQKER